MKRIQSACICQTLHFMLKEELGHDEAVRLVRDEIEKYKAGLEKSRTMFKILSEETQPDGSVLMKLVKQYNTASVGDYLNET